MTKYKVFCANNHIQRGPNDPNSDEPDFSILAMRRETCSTCGSIKGPGWTIRLCAMRSWWNPVGWFRGRWIEDIKDEE